eukprot:4256581-Pyramimonas_sp.AAC.1
MGTGAHPAGKAELSLSPWRRVRVLESGASASGAMLFRNRFRRRASRSRLGAAPIQLESGAPGPGRRISVTRI